MSDRLVYFNGQHVPESEARVSIFDSSLMFGDMAFEMTRTFNQQPFRLRSHLERLYASLRLLEIDCGMTIDEIEEVTHETLRLNLATEAGDMDWQIMHNVSRGPLPIYKTAFPEALRPTVSVNCWPLITHNGGFAPNYSSGVDLMIPSQQALPSHLVDMKAKTRSRLHYQTAQLQAARAGGKWPVLLDPDGFLAEGPGWNIFLVREGVLYTPEPRNILCGVTRGTTIELAQNAGIDVREANLGHYEALMADEIFCTSTSFCLVHAATFEGQHVGDSTPGPIFRQLRAAWNQLVNLDIVAQANEYAGRLPAWEAQQVEGTPVGTK